MTGTATNVCVHYTGADAHQYDYRTKVVEEATAGTYPEAHKATLQSLEYLQHGAIVHLDEVIEAMKFFRPSAKRLTRICSSLVLSYTLKVVSALS